MSMRVKVQHSYRVKAEALRLAASGMTTREIANSLGIPQGSISHWRTSLADGKMGKDGKLIKRPSVTHSPHTNEDRVRALRLSEQDFTYKEIAADMGISQGTVSGWISHFKNGGLAKDGSYIYEKVNENRTVIKSRPVSKKKRESSPASPVPATLIGRARDLYIDNENKNKPIEGVGEPIGGHQFLKLINLRIAKLEESLEDLHKMKDTYQQVIHEGTL